MLNDKASRQAPAPASKGARKLPVKGPAASPASGTGARTTEKRYNGHAFGAFLGAAP